MIFSLKKLSVICATLLLASASSFDNSAIAEIKNQPQLMANGRVSSAKSQSHPVFRSILPQLKQKTQIRVLLPKFIPESDGELPIYAIIETATQKKYDIILGFSPRGYCSGGTACRLGTVAAEAVTSKTPRLSGKTVALTKGITGYFEDFKCGANCSYATVTWRQQGVQYTVGLITWRQQGVQYTVGLKAGDRTSLVKMANSAITP